jgi:hypothetical protein
MNITSTSPALNLPFSPEFTSSLSNERINELNILALKATKNDNSSITDNQIHEHCLIIETDAMKEVYENILEFSTSTSFYENLDRAFNSLIEKEPEKRISIFTTYRELSAMLRTVEKHRDFIEQRYQEVAKILNDIDTLDGENLERHHN